MLALMLTRISYYYEIGRKWKQEYQLFEYKAEKPRLGIQEKLWKVVGEGNSMSRSTEAGGGQGYLQASEQKCMEVIGHQKALSWVKQRISENSCQLSFSQSFETCPLAYHIQLGAHFTLVY